MDRQADLGMQELKNQIMEMGGLAEQSILTAVQGFLTGDPQCLQTVRELEDRINRLHIHVDELCVKLLATQQPMGSDLRFIVSAIKINADLERIGDQAINVAGNAQRAHQGCPPEQEVKADFTSMSKSTRHMVAVALNAFVRNDTALAEAVLEMDDFVDSLKNTIFAKVMAAMEAGEMGIRKGLDLILIARNLEKIGDHASNIAEDVIYARSGLDVRHPLSRV